MAYLIQRFSSVAGSSAILRRREDEILRIGRGTGVGLQLKDAAVDLNHARIEPSGRGTTAGYRLVDEGSLTGTYLNGRQILDRALADGDSIEIGGYALVVSFAAEGAPAEAPMMVEVRRVTEAEKAAAPLPESAELAENSETAATAQGAAPAVSAPRPRRRQRLPEAPQEDYARAYALRQGRLNKAFLALALAAGTVVTTAALAWAWPGAYQPGPLSEAHASALDQAPHRAISGAGSCASCHRAWGGVPDRACGECHGAPRFAVHAERQARTPACTACHGEHRERSLTDFGSGSCVACHGALEVLGPEPPAIAVQVAAFPARHPPFRALEDPGTVALDHALHLDPVRLRLSAPEAISGCGDCHRLDGVGQLAAVDYEAHCQRCHALDFAADGSEPEGLHGRQLKDLKTLLRGHFLSGATPTPARVARAEIQADGIARRFAFGDCAKCHAFAATPAPETPPRALPRVLPAAIPRRWLGAARFTHGPHVDGGLEGQALDRACATCHPRAATSEGTADVMIPGIGSCITAGCHDGRRRLSTAGGTGAGLSDCAQCHRYHAQRS